MTNNISFNTNYLMMLYNNKKSEYKIATPMVINTPTPNISKSKYIDKNDVDMKYTPFNLY